MPGPGNHGHDLIAIDDRTILVTQDHPIRITIKRHAQIGPMGHDLFLQGCGRRRATVAVDIGAIGLNRHRHHIGAKFMEHTGGDLVGRAIGAIDNHLQAIETQPPRKTVLHEFDVTTLGVFQTPGTTKTVRRGQMIEEPVLHQDFDFLFHLIGELEPIRAKEFDSVVFIGIVRGRNHHTQIGPQGQGQHGNRRGRHGPDKHHIHPHGRESGLHGGLDHVIAQAGVFPDNHQMAVIATGETMPRGHRHTQGRFRRHRFLVGLATNAICTKKFACHIGSHEFSSGPYNTAPVTVNIPVNVPNRPAPARWRMPTWSRPHHAHARSARPARQLPERRPPTPTPAPPGLPPPSAHR